MMQIPDIPVLRRDLHAEILPDGLVTIDETGPVVLTGAAYGKIAALLDGRRSSTEVVAAVASQVASPVAWYVLQDLSAKGLLRPAAPELPRDEAGWWDSAGIATTARPALAVCVETLGPDPTALRQMLAENGLTETADGIRVVLVSDYLDPRLVAINARALAEGKPWLLVQPVGGTLWLGPLFLTGETACWACLAERLRLNRQLEDFCLRDRGETMPMPKSRAALPATEALAAAMAVSELALHAAGGQPRSKGTLVTVDTLTGMATDHAVTRRPHCSRCGDPALFQPDAPIRIGTVRAQRALGAGHRSMTASACFDRLKHHISPYTGVVTALENYIGHVEDLIYSYTAGHNFVMGQDSLLWVEQGLRTRTGGKGVTDIQARMSALGEAIERYAGVARGDEPARHGSLYEIGEAAVDPRLCLHFSDAQYASRRKPEIVGGSIFHQVPNPFDPTLRIDWAPVWSLTQDRRRYLPAAFCWYGHPDSRKHFFCAGDTNGCASGATPEEAMLQAFLEVVERDAVAIWWYNRIERPALDLSSFHVPYLDRLRTYYMDLGRTFWVLDLTADLGIPVFAAVSARIDHPVEDIVFGFGAHLDPTEALMRAVTEMNQFLPAVLKRNADGGTAYAWPEDDAIRFWQTETRARQPWLCPSAAPARRKSDFAQPDLSDVGATLRTCVDRCRTHGLEVLAQDQTRPDIGLHVYRIVVPGLRHFWRRFGPGRLYDVPVTMGWRANPTAEHELNPIPVFI